VLYELNARARLNLYESIKRPFVVTTSCSEILLPARHIPL